MRKGGSIAADAPALRVGPASLCPIPPVLSTRLALAAPPLYPSIPLQRDAAVSMSTSDLPAPSVLLVPCFEAGHPGLLLKVDPGCVTIEKRSLLIEKGGRHQYISALQFAGGGAAPGLCTGCAAAPLLTAGRWSAGRARSSHRGAWSIWERCGLREEGRYRPPAGSLPGGADRLTDRHVETEKHRYEDRTTPDRRDPRGSIWRARGPGIFVPAWPDGP